MAADDDNGDEGSDEPGPNGTSDGSAGADELNLVSGPWWAAGGCPNMVAFAAFLEGRLPLAHSDRIAAHLHQCRRCRRDATAITASLLESAARAEQSGDAAEGRSLEALASVGRALTEELAKAGDWETETGASGDAGARGADVAAPATPTHCEPTAAQRHPRTRIAMRVVAAGAVVALSAFLLGRWSLPREQNGRSTILPGERPFAGRFTGDLPWAPPVQSSAHIPTAYQRHLPRRALRYLATAEAQKRPPEAPTAGLLGAVGASQVLTGRVEPGIETLQRAAAAEPTSARLLNDLGAALLARAEASDRRSAHADSIDGETQATDVPAALEAISRALEISPRQREALFNRALALERMHLYRLARKAWHAYLEVDGDSPWAAEARRRLAAFVVPKRADATRIRSEIVAAAATSDRGRLGQLVLSYRQLARRTVQEELLPGWGRAWLAGDGDEAERQLDAAAAVAEEWRAQTNDSALLQAVAEIQTATAGARRRLATGYRALGEASRAFDSFDLDVAQTAAEQAVDALPATSQGAAWASLVRLTCSYHRGEGREEDARQIVRLAPTDATVAARAGWIVGVSHANRGNLATALAMLRGSLDTYEKLDEIDSSAWLHFLVAEAYGYMGASDASWEHLLLALEHRHALTGNQFELGLLNGAALLALFEGRPRVAIDLLDEGLIEPVLDKPYEIAEVYVTRSRILHDLGRDFDARSDLQRAALWLSRSNPAEQRYFTANAELHLVAGLLEADPLKAVTRISRALARFRDTGRTWRLPGVLLARARARLRAGDAVAAEADLRQGLVLLAEQQGVDPASSAWTTRLDGPEELFDELVRLALGRGDAEEALAVAEASRTRRLSAGTAAKPLRPAEIQSRLDPDVTVLFYAWLPERVLLWRLDRGGTSLVEIESRPAELAQLVSAFGTDLAAGAWAPATREVAMRLHAALVRPARVGTGRLVIVPDGALHGLPFAALVDPESGSFLMEQHELSMASSVTSFLHRQTRFEAQRPPPTTALVLGDPRVDPVLFPSFEPLAGAREEASAVAELYPRRELLLGAAATRPAFLALAGRREVLHFSGHAVPNRVAPERSSLPLADGAGGDGLLVAADIAKLDLTGTRTIVLSGCETGISADDGEASLSLASAFLAADAPNVVASLWPIADAPSAPLMTAFHRRLRRGERPATALRSAQLELARGKDAILASPAVWAAFTAFSG